MPIPKKFQKNPRPTRLRRNPKERTMQVEKRSFKLAEAAIMLNMAYNTLKAKILGGHVAYVPGTSGKGLRGARITVEEIERQTVGSQVRIRPA